MKLKSLFLVAVLLVFSYTAKSQLDDISFRLHSGLNAQTFSGQDMTGDKLSLNAVPRFNVGVMIDFPIVSKLFIKTGLLFNTKGARSDQFMGMPMSLEYNIAYLEIPLSALYKVPLNSGHLLFGFGPYLSYGIIGYTQNSIANIYMDERIVFADEYESITPYVWRNIKPFDYGGNLFFGYEFESGFSCQVNMQLGMANIIASNNLHPTNTIFRNRGFGVCVEYRF
jgi:hypothetical protein